MNTDLIKFPLVVDNVYFGSILKVWDGAKLYEWEDIFKVLEIKHTDDIFVDVINKCEETYNLPTPMFIFADIVIGNPYKILRYKELSNEWKTYYDSLLNSSRMGKFSYIKSKGFPISKTGVFSKYKENEKVFNSERHCYTAVVL